MGVIPRAVYSGIDFYEYREYCEGDDIRYIDWNILARLDKKIIRTFCSDYKSSIDIVIDTSLSMTLGEPAKRWLSETVAFFLVNIAKNTNSNYCAYTFSNSDIYMFKNYNIFTSAYRKGEISYQGATYLNKFLTSYTNLKKDSKADFLFLISDLHCQDNLEIFFNNVVKLAKRVVIMQVYSSKEIENIKTGRILIEEPETGATREVFVNKLTKKVFMANYEKFLLVVKKYAWRNGIILIQIDSSSCLDKIVQYLLMYKVIKKEK